MSGSDPARERGMVLVSLLFLLSLLALGTGASLWLTRAELWTAGRARSHLQALYTAEAGVRHALAVLAPAADFSAAHRGLLHALADPGNPGPWPFAGGSQVYFPGPPFAYAVEIVGGTDSPGDSARLVVRSNASAVRGAIRSVTATIARARAPYAPAVLVATSGELALAPGVTIDARAPADGEQAGIGAASSESLAAAARAASSAGAVLRGRPERIVTPFDVAELARASGLAESDPILLASGVGSSDVPAAAVVRGGASAGLHGEGVVVVNGDLAVTGPLDFAGVLFVAGNLELGGSACAMRGMVWARAVVLRGPCTLTFDEEAIAKADAVLRLPRLPVLLALSDG